MVSIREVARKKIIGNAPNTVMMKLSKENVMVNGVESLREIKKYANSVIVEVKGRRNLIINI